MKLKIRPDKLKGRWNIEADVPRGESPVGGYIVFRQGPYNNREAAERVRKELERVL